MNEAVATETPAAETPVADSPAVDNSKGLLESASPANKDQAPATETPSPDAKPGQATQRPVYIAEQFWDAEKGTLKDEALGNSYNDLRKEFNKLQQQKGGDAPETAEEYLVDYKPPHRSRPTGDQKEGDVLDRFGELEANDPVFVAMSEFAKNGKMSPADFTDGMQTLMEKIHPLLEKPMDGAKEREILGEGADQLIQVNNDWVHTLVRNGVLNEDELHLMMNFGSTALGVQLTDKLRRNSGEKSIPVNLNGGANKGVKTPDECDAMLNDPRYHMNDSVGEAYRAQVTAEFTKTHGDKEV